MHRRSADASPDRLWHAAESVRVSEAATLGRVLRWRIPGTPADLPFRDVFRRYPFTVLDEGERWSISGLCGRVWSLRRDYPRLEGADDFRDWDEPGTVRVLFAHWVEDDYEPTLVSESRVQALGSLRPLADVSALDQPREIRAPDRRRSAERRGAQGGVRGRKGS